MLPESMQNLIDQLKKLPGIGPKSAERLAFFLLRSHKSNLKELGNAVLDLTKGVALCNVCFNVSEQAVCDICRDDRRDRTMICVVEEPTDAITIEHTREYKGLYHVLHGRISPLDRIHPQDLKIQELVRRLKPNGAGAAIKEIIIATNPDVEGETTALYLAKILKPFGAKVTRIARGLPVGSDLEYADQITLTRALEGRQEL